MDAPPQPSQTFGIELELLCFRPAMFSQDIAPSLPGSNSILDAVYDALVRHGVPVPDHNSLDINDTAPPYSQWRVEEEVLSLTPEELALLPEGYVVEPLELASRKFFHAGEDWRGEICAVLTALNELEIVHGVKFITNSSTGFHVHVGDSSPAPLPFRTAKNVLLYCMAYEPLIDGIHAVDRILEPSWKKTERHHCFPLSFFGIQHEMGDSIFDRLREIEQITTYEQLGAFFVVPAEDMNSGEATTGHNASMNFDNLFPDAEQGRHAETLTGTIEFRQHAGTLDATAIVAWAEFTTALVRFCNEATGSPSDTWSFIATLAAATDPTTDLFALKPFNAETTLPLPDEVREYYASLIAGTLTKPVDPFMLTATPPLAPLILANLNANAQSTSRAAVERAVLKKVSDASYGHDPVLAPFAPKQEMVFAMLEEKESQCLDAGFDVESEEGVSFVMQAGFDKLTECHAVAIGETFRGGKSFLSLS